MARHLDNNPRLVKQFINLFRLRAYVACETEFLGHLAGPEKDVVQALCRLGKFVALGLRNPLFLTDVSRDQRLWEAALEAAYSDLANHAAPTDPDPRPRLRHWLSDEGLLALLRHESDLEGAQERDCWSLQGLDLKLLLSVSPEVSTIKPAPTAGEEAAGGTADEARQSATVPVQPIRLTLSIPEPTVTTTSLHDEDAEELLAALLSDDQPTVQAAAEKIRSRSPEQTFEYVEALRRGLEADDERTRKSAARALGFIGGPEAARSLIKRVPEGSASASVREFALAGLATMGLRAGDAVPDLIEPLLSIFDDESYAGLYEPAARALSQMAPEAGERLPKIINAFLAGLRSDSPTRREICAQAFRRMGEVVAERRSDVIGALLDCLLDTSAPVRVASIQALGRLKATEAVETLLAFLGNVTEQTEVRAAAAAALGDLGDSDAVSALAAALLDQHWLVRSRAASALGQLRSREAVEALSAALTDDESHVRIAAAIALGQIGDVSATGVLIDRLDDPDVDARGAATRSLGRIKDERAVPALIRALGDDDAGRVRRAAEEALRAINTDEARRALRERGLGDGEGDTEAP